jgi:flagellin
MQLTHNINSLLIYKNYKAAVAKSSQSVENLSSGKKLNSAKDNPSKVDDVEKLKISVLSRQAASSNMQDTNSMVQTFDGALQEMTNNVSRLKELAIKAASGTVSDEDSTTIKTEMDSILSSINDLANNTEFNGVKLSVNTDTTKKTTIGSESDETIDIPFENVTTTGLGLDGLTNMDSDQTLKAIEASSTKITSLRSKYGAIETRLDDTQNNDDEISDTLTSAQSSLEDADLATESMKNASAQILIQLRKLPLDMNQMKLLILLLRM